MSVWAYGEVSGFVGGGNGDLVAVIVDERRVLESAAARLLLLLMMAVMMRPVINGRYRMDRLVVHGRLVVVVVMVVLFIRLLQSPRPINISRND